MWYYVQTEDHLWTVVHPGTTGVRVTDTDHTIRECAARRVSFLNGGQLQFESECICGGEA